MSARPMLRFALQIVASKTYGGGGEKGVPSDGSGVSAPAVVLHAHRGLTNAHKRRSAPFLPTSQWQKLYGAHAREGDAIGREVSAHYRLRRRCAPVRVCALGDRAGVGRQFSQHGD